MSAKIMYLHKLKPRIEKLVALTLERKINSEELLSTKRYHDNFPDAITRRIRKESIYESHYLQTHGNNQIDHVSSLDTNF